MTFGVGIAGGGTATEAIHLPTLSSLSNLYEVKRVMEPAGEVAARLTAQYSIPVCATYEELVDDPDIDVVLLNSPAEFHCKQILGACEAGKRAVLCEKPLGLDLSEAELAIDAADEAGVTVLVGAMHRFDPGWSAAWARWSAFGTMATNVHSSIFLPRNEYLEECATERITRATDGQTAAGEVRTEADRLRGHIVNLIIHDIPLIRLAIGATDEVSCLGARAVSNDGYLIALQVGQALVSFCGRFSEYWDPIWRLEFDDGGRHAMEVEFPPSFVSAGSAAANIWGADGQERVGPLSENGYMVEWRQLADQLDRGLNVTPSGRSSLADLRFALNIAECVTASVSE